MPKERAIVVVNSADVARNIGAWPMFAQSGQRAPTGDCTMHWGQIRSSHLPHRRLEAMSEWRRQVVSKVSLVIDDSGYSLNVDIRHAGFVMRVPMGGGADLANQSVDPSSV
ncbi:MAG: hypothetical protein IIA53_03580 [Chloroflexi bacterium]|nr:hypothetical protein [Chloroflexota bacterium]